MGKEKIYIAGKVSGLPIHQVTMKFGAAQKQLEAKGYEAINPLAVVNDFKCPWQKAMKLCLIALLECDGIVLLPDWADSPGARMEQNIAYALGMKEVEL